MLGSATAETFVNDKQIGICFDSQSDGFRFTQVEVLEQSNHELAILDRSSFDPSCVQDGIPARVTLASKQFLPDSLGHQDLTIELL